ncbi:hypothetical protein IIB50_02985 [Patescibacteria group bacterium]|nr:hypothetical protein [Patescibacteria group bacterium]
MNRTTVVRSSRDGDEGITATITIPLLGFSDEEIQDVTKGELTSEDQLMDRALGSPLERIVYFLEACKLQGARGMFTGLDILGRKLDEARQEMLAVMNAAEQTKNRPPG